MKAITLFLSLTGLALCLSCANNNESFSEKEIDQNPGVATKDSIMDATRGQVDTGTENTITPFHDGKKK